MSIFGHGATPPPPPPPPPSPPMQASNAVAQAGEQERAAAAAAAGGMGFDSTLLTSGQGSKSPATTTSAGKAMVGAGQ